MFSDNTNVSLPSQNINKRYEKFSGKLKNVGDPFKEKNFPLITRKLNPSFFHVQSAKQDLPLKLPALNKADNNTK